MTSTVKELNNASSVALNPSESKKVVQNKYDDVSKFLDKPVPIVKIKKILEKVDLVQKIDKKTQKDYIEDAVAFGILYGVNEEGSFINSHVMFQGNFSGAMFFKKQPQEDKPTVYFQGKIKKFNKKNGIILSVTKSKNINQNEIEQSSMAHLQAYNQNRFNYDSNAASFKLFQLNLTEFKGFFKGSFYYIKNLSKINPADTSTIKQLLGRLSKENEIDLEKILNDKKQEEQKKKKQKQLLKSEEIQQKKKKLNKKIAKKNNEKDKEKTSVTNYYLPTMVTLQLGKITQINLEKSAADISGTLNIDIRLNQEIIDLLEADQTQYQKKQLEKLSIEQQQTANILLIKKKLQLSIDFHRGKLMNLPFYKVDKGKGQQQDIEDEWADIWQGIDLNYQWDQKRMIMSYKITTIFTAEIDNTYGIFYSPFNLNIIKIVIDFHAIKLGDNKLNFNCCDLTDSESTNNYQPYTFFSDLGNDNNKGSDSRQNAYRKHMERRSKINIDNFIDMGEYKLADNRITLFPYHKRVFDNSTSRSNKLQQILGIGLRSSRLTYPIIKNIDQAFEEARAKEKEPYQKITFPVWEFVHVEIPIFKYPVIDMIRIFVPILILSIISLLIFVQQNAKDGNGFTTLSKRIASGCSLMIAYVALVPLIRAKLPPTPSVTLIQILIYASTIPNFLAIISNLSTEFIDYNDFFSNYLVFSDGLFIASFIISILSFIILLIIIIVYSKKAYQSDFFLKRSRKISVDQARNPNFLRFIENLKKYRKEYHVTALDSPNL